MQAKRVFTPHAIVQAWMHRRAHLILSLFSIQDPGSEMEAAVRRFMMALYVQLADQVRPWQSRGVMYGLKKIRLNNALDQ